jgi:hypothetical protein
MLTAIAILWVFIWALVLVDLFRRDWSTGVKVAWAIGILILPVVGVLAYLIVRPPSAADGPGVTGPSDSHGASTVDVERDRHPV